jgi:DNA-binding CsgD family transcriptional regulator
MNSFIRRSPAGRGRRTVRRAVAPSPPGHSAGRFSANQTASLEDLTKREIEILRLIAEEHTNQEIANKLFISPRTVDTHRRNLILKLDAKNTAGLVRFAIKHNLVRL